MSHQEISLQLYTVKDALAADLKDTVARLAEIGLNNVEPVNFVGHVPELKEAFGRYDIASPTGHGFLVSDTITLPNGQTMSVPSRSETLAAAKELGIQVVIDPSSPGNWTSREGIQFVASRLNEAAAEAEDLGLTVGYHNHDWEVQTLEGRPAIELFAELLDPRVRLEVDLYWATAAGADVPKLLGNLGERVVALHVKDGPMAGGRSTASVPTDQTPAGRGDVDLTGAFEAAPSARFFVIEFDQYQGDIFEAVEASFQWLAGRPAEAVI